MVKKQKWYIQKYDEDGFACKMPREFYGTKKQAKKYAMDKATIIDIIWQRTIKIYSSEEYDVDSIPQEIKIYKI